MQYGPISTPLERRAPSSTIAVGCTFIAFLYSVRDHRAIFGIGAKNVARVTFARKPPNGSAFAQRLDRHSQHIARPHRPAKARLIYRQEIDNAIGAFQSERMHHKRAGGLRHCLNDENARHDRIVRKMASKVWFVE